MRAPGKRPRTARPGRPAGASSPASGGGWRAAGTDRDPSAGARSPDRALRSPRLVSPSVCSAVESSSHASGSFGVSSVVSRASETDWPDPPPASRKTSPTPTPPAPTPNRTKPRPKTSASRTNIHFAWRRSRGKNIVSSTDGAVVPRRGVATAACGFALFGGSSRIGPCGRPSPVAVLAGYESSCNALRRASEDDGRNRIFNRLEQGCSSRDDDGDVRLLPADERADLAVHPEHACAPERRELERVARRERVRAAARGPARRRSPCGAPRTGRTTASTRGCRSRCPTAIARGSKLRERRDAAAEDPVRARAVRDADAVRCEERDLLVVRRGRSARP